MKHSYPAQDELSSVYAFLEGDEMKENADLCKKSEGDDSTGSKGTDLRASVMLLEARSKSDRKEWDEASRQYKEWLGAHHKKRTLAMLDYYSALHDFSSPVDGCHVFFTRRPRAFNRAAAAILADSARPTNNSISVSHHRRLWVRDRSKAWWDECNKPDFPEEDFRRAFRMSRETFDMLCDELGSVVAKEDTMLRAAIPVRQRVAVCIWRLATGEPLREVSRKFGLGISTCHKLVLEVCSAIKNVLMPRYIQWPDELGLRTIINEFESISGIPNIVGAMYTTHVSITAPKISLAAYFNKRRTERNQKPSFSVTVQGVVNTNSIFTDVCIGWPGSMTDDQVLENSALSTRANAGLLNGIWIVGNSGYPLLDWVLVPYTQQNLTWTQHAFNEKIGEIHKVARIAFTRLKGRWACLKKRNEVKLQDLPLLLGACCVLHNVCEFRNEGMDPNLRCELADDEMVPDYSLRSTNSMKARDAIAHNLLHHGLAGNAFL